MKFITLKKLKEMEACGTFQKEFVEIFGEKAKVSIEKMIEYLNKNKKNDWKIWLIRTSLRLKDIRLVKKIIEYDNDANTKDHNGSTALMWATGSGHKKIIELLIDRGADVNTIDNNGDTALIWARYQNIEIFKLLINRGANVDTINYYGDTALRLALRSKHGKIVDLLKEHGAIE